MWRKLKRPDVNYHQTASRNDLALTSTKRRKLEKLALNGGIQKVAEIVLKMYLSEMTLKMIDFLN